jgi:hypothetical protein
MRAEIVQFRLPIVISVIGLAVIAPLFGCASERVPPACEDLRNVDSNTIGPCLNQLRFDSGDSRRRELEKCLVYRGLSEDWADCDRLIRKQPGLGPSLADDVQQGRVERRRKEKQEEAAALQQAKEHKEKEAEAQNKYRATVAEQVRKDQERGYKLITFDDFKLDGKQLAANDAKVSVKGIYRKSYEAEALFPPSGQTGADSIGLITDDAPRSIRKYFLECPRSFSWQSDCSITVLGRVRMCKTLATSKDVPCLIVEDGWYIPPPR